jgi:ABC-type dipeptide/oligopeptide/nickel transport system permease subunit
MISGVQGSFFYLVSRRFLRHKLAVAGLLVLVIMFTVSLFAPFLSPYDPLEQFLDHRLQGISWNHTLGTDNYGRDILTRIIYGGRLSMFMGFISVGLGLLSGGLIGLLSGYFRSLDNILMRLMDILLAFPAILLAIGIMAILGPGLINVMLAVGVRTIPGYARITRSVVLYIKEMPYIEASVSMGASNFRTIFQAILPNSFPPILVYSTLQLGNAILLAAVLSYLGLGVQPPIPEWGIMVCEGRSWLRSDPQIAIYPGLAILLVVMAINLVGDGLRDSLDIRLKDTK